MTQKPWRTYDKQSDEIFRGWVVSALQAIVQIQLMIVQYTITGAQPSQWRDLEEVVSEFNDKLR